MPGVRLISFHRFLLNHPGAFQAQALVEEKRDPKGQRTGRENTGESGCCRDRELAVEQAWPLRAAQSRLGIPGRLVPPGSSLLSLTCLCTSSSQVPSTPASASLPLCPWHLSLPGLQEWGAGLGDLWGGLRGSSEMGRARVEGGQEECKVGAALRSLLERAEH